MKNFLKKSLLIIGLMVGALFVMSAELVKVERHTLGVQIEQSIDVVSIDVSEVVLIAFDCTAYLPTINEEEVEISYGINQMVATSFIDSTELSNHMRLEFLTHKRETNVVTQKQKCTRLDLKRAGTVVIYGVDRNNTNYIKNSERLIIVKSGEVRIRGRPTTNQNV